MQPRQPAQRLHEAEAALEIHAQHGALHHAPVVEGKPDRLRLGDEVADGEHKAALVDHNAGALALGAQGAGGEGVGRHEGLHGHDAVEPLLEREGKIGGVGLEGRRDLPIVVVHGSWGT